MGELLAMWNTILLMGVFAYSSLVYRFTGMSLVEVVAIYKFRKPIDILLIRDQSSALAKLFL